MKTALVILVSVLSVFTTAFAANVAYDAASNSTYDSGWTAGLNGGSGFGAWTLSPQPNGSAGFFVWDSTQNGTFPSGGINTGGESLGFYGNGAAADGWRSFQGGALAVDQSFRIDFDNGWIGGGTSVGWGLQNSSSQNLFEVWFTGGDSYYTINDFSGAHASSNGWTDGGLRLQVTLKSSTNYNLSIIQGTATNTYTGFLISQANQGIQQFHIWNGGAGSGQNFDAYINSMSVIPEPGTMALMGLALAGMTMFFRHVRGRKKI
jgi:hypothetical protein